MKDIQNFLMENSFFQVQVQTVSANSFTKTLLPIEILKSNKLGRYRISMSQ